MSLAKLIHCIVTDEAFFYQFLHDPHAMLKSIGLMLDEQTLVLITKMLSSHPQVHEFYIAFSSAIPVDWQNP